MPNSTDKASTVWPELASGNAGVPERRIAVRFPCTAAAEVVDLKSKARVTGRSTDLGLGGCYVDTLAPFAVGATVQVRLERDKREMEATGVVTYALVSMGMGLSFTEIKPKYQMVLKDWIAELGGTGANPAQSPADPELEIQHESIGDLESSSEQAPTATAAGNRQVLNELINLMVRKRLINEGEAAALLRQMYR